MDQWDWPCSVVLCGPEISNVIRFFSGVSQMVVMGMMFWGGETSLFIFNDRVKNLTNCNTVRHSPHGLITTRLRLCSRLRRVHEDFSFLL